MGEGIFWVDSYNKSPSPLTVGIDSYRGEGVACLPAGRGEGATEG